MTLCPTEKQRSISKPTQGFAPESMMFFRKYLQGLSVKGFARAPFSVYLVTITTISGKQLQILLLLTLHLHNGNMLFSIPGQSVLHYLQKIPFRATVAMLTTFYLVRAKDPLQGCSLGCLSSHLKTSSTPYCLINNITRA